MITEYDNPEYLELVNNLEFDEKIKGKIIQEKGITFPKLASYMHIGEAALRTYLNVRRDNHCTFFQYHQGRFFDVEDTWYFMSSKHPHVRKTLMALRQWEIEREY